MTFEAHQVVLNLKGASRTEKGLEVPYSSDVNEYEKGPKITDEKMAEVFECQ